MGSGATWGMRSRPVTTATTPGSARAAAASMPRMLRVGVRAADEGDVEEARQRDVGDVLRRARDQTRVFLALDLSSEKLGCHGGFVLLGQMIRQNAAACAARGFTAPGRVARRRMP